MCETRSIMPIYEYQCQSCGHELEEMQKISDAPLKTCPKCGQDELSKLVSASRFKLTGTGWYETDFKNKGQKPKASESSDRSSGDSSATQSTKDDKKAE